MLGFVMLVGGLVHSLFQLTPANRMLSWARRRKNLKWGIVVALAGTGLYGGATYLCGTLVEHGGPGWLNLLVILFSWNTIKFTLLGPFAVARLLIARTHEHPHR